MGDLSDRWRNPLMTFLWKDDKGSRWLSLNVIADNPDLAMGQTKILNKWICTWGLSRHFEENAGPSSLNKAPRAFLILASTFFSSSLRPLTIRPRWSLSSLTETGRLAIVQGWICLYVVRLFWTVEGHFSVCQGLFRWKLGWSQSKVRVESGSRLNLSRVKS